MEAPGRGKLSEQITFCPSGLLVPATIFLKVAAAASDATSKAESDDAPTTTDDDDDDDGGP